MSKNTSLFIMDWIFFFFIFSLLLLIGCLFVKRMFVHIIKKKLLPLFGETLEIIGGQKTFSLTKAKGKNQKCEFDIENAKIEFDILGLINPQGTQLFSITADKFHFEMKDFEFKKHEPKRVSLKNFIFGEITKNLFLIIFNSFKFKVKDAFISINGFKFTADKVGINYKRQDNILNLDFDLEETVFVFHFPSIRVPSIQLTISASVDCLRHLMKSLFSDFSIFIPSINICYDKAKFQLNTISSSISCKNDPYSKGDLTLQPIDVYVPLFDLLTTNITISIEETFISKNLLTTNRISITRMNLNMLSIPSLTLKDKKFTLGPLDVAISSPMFIDIGLLARFFKEKLALHPKQDAMYDKYAFFRTLSASSPSGTLKIFFSDSHAVKFSLTKINFNDMVVSCKKLSGCILFGSQVIHFISGTSVSARVEPPKLDVKAADADLVLSDDFTEATFIQEISGIFKYLQSHIRGGSWETMKDKSPTRLIFTLVLTKGTVRFQRRQIAVDMTRAQEAKRAAMEELRFRQEKAIQIIQSQDSKSFNQEAFDRESKQIFLQLYKKALDELPPPETNLFTVDIKGLECGMNGSLIPNRQAALNKIKEICDEVKDEDIGRISGAPYFGTCEHVAWSIPYNGVVYEADKIESKGTFFTTYAPGKVAADFYMFKILCDEGQEEFKIPMVSAKSVVFLDINATCNKLFGKWGFSFLEWAHDFKLSSRVFRQRHYKVKWLQMIDHVRFRTRFKIDLKANEFHYGLNDPVDGYGKPYYNFIWPNFHLLFDGKDYHLTGSRSLVCLETNAGMKTILTFYYPKASLQWQTHNDMMPKDRKRPIFIPIDSSRMTDENYDPFEQWRTVTWSLHIDFITSNRSCLIDLDQLQDLIDRLTTPRQAIEKFFKPPLFVLRFSPWPKYGFIDLHFKSPPILMTMMQGALTAKITGDPIIVTYNNSLPLSLSVKSNDVNVVCSYNMRQLLNITLSNMSVTQNRGVILVNISNVEAEAILNTLIQIKEFPLKFHHSVQKKELAPILSVEDLYHHFNNIKLTLSISQINLNIINESERILGVDISRLIIESRADDNKILMNSITFSECNLISLIDNPIVSIKGPQLCIAAASNRKIIACTLNAVEVSVMQEELDFLIPFTTQLFDKKGDDSSIDKHVSKPEFLVMFALETLSCNLLQQNRSKLVSLVVHGASANLKRAHDLSEVVKASIRKIDAENCTVADAFHTIFRCPDPAHDILCLQLNKTRPLMRCPVFDRIDITLAPFVIALDIKFIMQIAGFFKSTEDIHVLDFSEEEIDKIQAEELIQTVDTTKEDSNVFFCRMFRFNPIDAGLNIRFPRDGVLSEFLNRPFQFSGLSLEDIFGTKQQVVNLLKKNIKWAAIKALPKFFFKKSKE